VPVEPKAARKPPIRTSCSDRKERRDAGEKLDLQILHPF